MRTNRWWNCLKLNLRMLANLVHGRILRTPHFAAGYDELAGGYEANWLVFLRPVTDRLIDAVPPLAPGAVILDLGCGTGYALHCITERFPGVKAAGIDISAGMLAEASKNCASAKFVQSDMLEYLRSCPSGEADCVISCWAVGYTDWRSVFFEVKRVLKPGGAFVFVTNLADTMPAVFHAYRRTMAAFPEQVGMAMFPSFPKQARQLRSALDSQRWITELAQEDVIKITPPDGAPMLSWLLKTGVLAGFDHAVDLRHNPEAAAYFEAELGQYPDGLHHHYYLWKGHRT